MKSFFQRYYWHIIVPIYFLCTLFLLTLVSPISVDGGGVSPTFYWGERAPHPTLVEYNRDRSLRARILLPYFLAAGVLTGLGCSLSAAICQKLKSKIPFPRVGSFFVFLILIVVISLASDLGTTLRLWKGPILVSSFESLILTLKLAIPAAVSSRRYSLAPADFQLDLTEVNTRLDSHLQ